MTGLTTMGRLKPPKNFVGWDPTTPMPTHSTRWMLLNILKQAEGIDVGPRTSLPVEWHYVRGLKSKVTHTRTALARIRAHIAGSPTKLEAAE
jgi:hypothetical protein